MLAQVAVLASWNQASVAAFSAGIHPREAVLDLAFEGREASVHVVVQEQLHFAELT